MAVLNGLYAREILDGTGNPTIECTVWSDSGFVAASSAASSTRVSPHAKQQLSDGNYQHLMGQGVLESITFLNEVVRPACIGKDPLDQGSFDSFLQELEAAAEKPIDPRALLAVSQAVLKLAALVTDTPLYYYIQQQYQLVGELFLPDSIASIASGGLFGTDNLDFAEFLLLPASHLPYPEEVNAIYTIFAQFKAILLSKNAIYATGPTGAYVPNLYGNSDVFELLIEAVKQTTYTFAQDLFFGITADAQLFANRGKYTLKDKHESYTPKEMIEYYTRLRSLYHVTYIEDPFSEEDAKWWQALTTELGKTTLVASNRSHGSNPEQIALLAQERHSNAVVIELPHQGTITATLAAIASARQNQQKIILSIADRETNDDFLADFAVGVGSDYFKSGAPNRGENIAKYNRLLQIYEEIQYQTATSQSYVAP